MCASLASAAENLDRYYVYYPGPQSGEPGYREGAFARLPRMKAKNIRPDVTNDITATANIRAQAVPPYHVQITDINGGGFACTPIPITWPVVAGMVTTRRAEFIWGSTGCYSDGGSSASLIFGRWTLSESFEFGAPVRRYALDGSAFDASPMVIRRSGEPWMTLHWGYRLGLVETTLDWKQSSLFVLPELANWPFKGTFDEGEAILLNLPPPFREDDVVEYVNKTDFPRQPGGQFFYAVLASDKTLLDAQPNWQRTGNAFKSGGYVSVCRFYGGKNGGPNTHFYSADDKECTALKAIPELSYEGQTFAVNMPLPGSNADGTKPCPVESKPLFRLYNNASNSNGRFVSNHRYTTDRTEVAVAVREGWADEGQVMCVPQ